MRLQKFSEMCCGAYPSKSKPQCKRRQDVAPCFVPLEIIISIWFVCFLDAGADPAVKIHTQEQKCGRGILSIRKDKITPEIINLLERAQIKREMPAFSPKMFQAKSEAKADVEDNKINPPRLNE